MRRPLDRTLGQWIRELISEGKIYRFYKCEEWLRLKAHVLEEFHGECADCIEEGKYTPAYLVHHEREVRDYPDLALSEWYTDEQGESKRNLWPLCFNCHELRHGRCYKGKSNPRKGFTNEERW